MAILKGFRNRGMRLHYELEVISARLRLETAANEYAVANKVMRAYMARSTYHFFDKEFTKLAHATTAAHEKLMQAVEDLAAARAKLQE